MTRLPILTGLAAAATVAMSLSASAAPQAQINSVVGVWSDVVPGNTVNLTNNGPNEIRWGTPFEADDVLANRSGYRFDGAAPDGSGDPLGPFLEDTDFGLGTFTHFNNPLQGEPDPSSITSARLTVTINADFSLEGFGDGASITNKIVNSTFDFNHFESPNNDDPCSIGNPDPADEGVNENGCADSVTPTLNVGLTEQFDFGGTTWVFNVSNLGTGPVFWTTEDAANEALLTGNFTAATNVIPLPAPFLLLMGGIAGLGFVSRKRKAA